MKNKPMKIHEIASHRNGVAGNSFYVVRFDGRKHGGSANMIATVFPEHGNIAVLSIPLLAENNITFGENSWRGDDFEWELRDAINASEWRGELAAGDVSYVIESTSEPSHRRWWNGFTWTVIEGAITYSEAERNRKPLPDNSRWVIA